MDVLLYLDEIARKTFKEPFSTSFFGLQIEIKFLTALRDVSSLPVTAVMAIFTCFRAPTDSE